MKLPDSVRLANRLAVLTPRVARRYTPLSEMLPVYRALHALSVRELAKQIGVSAATVSRIEHGKMCDVPTFLKLLRWLMYQPLRVSL